MIIGLGIDVLEVKRMERDLGDKEGLEEALFTPAEIAYCRARRYPAMHFAVRFAAKEAMFKALGTGQRGMMSWRDIEILNDDAGRPGMTLSGAVKTFADTLGATTVWLSLSHTREIATATVVLEK